jgi:hypothetical protein
MTIEQRIALLDRLGRHLESEDEYLQAVMHRSEYHNPWFTRANQERAVQAIARHFLKKEALETWASRYPLPPQATGTTVGIVMAGNIPLVGFHDWLCVFMAGHRAQVKLSEKDAYLFPYLLKLLKSWEPFMGEQADVVERLKGYDAVIATGSDNSARYFEAYFGKHPHIIRRNRNGVAVLSGKETREELLALGDDVFSFFGLGCRNVSKLYVPEGYDFDSLLEALHEYRQIVLNEKYRHNFDYNYALYMMNKVAFKANGCVLIKEDPSPASRIACLHYESYDTLEAVERDLLARQEQIQCVMAQPGLLSHPSLPFGAAQQPSLGDYADGVDTMVFLCEL